MARSLEALARDWSLTTDHERMRISLKTWELRHPNEASYQSELDTLSQNDARILYNGFLMLSQINTRLFSQLMARSLGKKL